MQRTAVKSSNVRSVGYDPQSKTLEVEFTSGTVYRFDGVPAEVHEGLMSAESMGSYFARNIRGKYQSEKAVPEVAPAPEAQA